MKKLRIIVGGYMGIYPTGGATLDDIQGKLVAAQETGWSKFIPEGEGLFSFTAMNSSIRAVKLITEDYSYHSKTAKVPARDFFQSDRVLNAMLSKLN